jgi:hypothetical protein
VAPEDSLGGYETAQARYRKLACVSVPVGCLQVVCACMWCVDACACVGQGCGVCE